MLCVGTALFGMFFFLPLFLQNVGGYSALKTGIAYLPMIATVMAASGIASQLVNRIGARPLLVAGSVIATGGVFWLSRAHGGRPQASGPLRPVRAHHVQAGVAFVPPCRVS